MHALFIFLSFAVTGLPPEHKKITTQAPPFARRSPLSLSLSQASIIWIIGEYAERIDNADEQLEHFLETFEEESAEVQLQLLTATVKLFLKQPEDTQVWVDARMGGCTSMLRVRLLFCVRAGVHVCITVVARVFVARVFVCARSEVVGIGRPASCRSPADQ